MTHPTEQPSQGLRWKDFEDSERWKVALGVWWRILVVSLGVWLALSVLFALFAVLAIQAS